MRDCGDWFVIIMWYSLYRKHTGYIFLLGGKNAMNILEIKNLRKIYGAGETQVRALDGINLTVERGEFVAIVGSSGSGKNDVFEYSRRAGCAHRRRDYRGSEKNSGIVR